MRVEVKHWWMWRIVYRNNKTGKGDGTGAALLSNQSVFFTWTKRGRESVDPTLINKKKKKKKNSYACKEKRVRERERFLWFAQREGGV